MHKIKIYKISVSARKAFANSHILSFANSHIFSIFIFY